MTGLLLAVEWNKDGIGICEFATAVMMFGMTLLGVAMKRKKVAL